MDDGYLYAKTEEEFLSVFEHFLAVTQHSNLRIKEPKLKMFEDELFREHDRERSNLSLAAPTSEGVEVYNRRRQNSDGLEVVLGSLSVLGDVHAPVDGSLLGFAKVDRKKARPNGDPLR